MIPDAKSICVFIGSTHRTFVSRASCTKLFETIHCKYHLSIHKHCLRTEIELIIAIIFLIFFYELVNYPILKPWASTKSLPENAVLRIKCLPMTFSGFFILGHQLFLHRSSRSTGCPILVTSAFANISSGMKPNVFSVLVYRVAQYNPISCASGSCE